MELHRQKEGEREAEREREINYTENGRKVDMYKLNYLLCLVMLEGIIFEKVDRISYIGTIVGDVVVARADTHTP